MINYCLLGELNRVMKHFGDINLIKLACRFGRANIVTWAKLSCPKNGSHSIHINSPTVQQLACRNSARRFSSFQPNPNPKMATATWQEEKKKYLQMSLHDKRKDYKCGDSFVTLDDLVTWDEYILKRKLPPKKSPMPADFSINMAKNTKLCKKISIFRGDITTLEVDAIVNAANKSLLGGGGVDGAINRAAGPHLHSENKTHGGCNIGEVKVSGGYQLPARLVLSTVGPQGERPEMLRKCYKNAMETMAKLNLKTIAFPSISTGIYGYPVRPAAHISAQEVRRALELHEDKIERVVFCLFSEVDEETYSQVLLTYFPLS